MKSCEPTVRNVLGDPLSELSRKERRILLLASTVGIFVAWTDVVPTRIAALGIEFSELNQQYFLLFLLVAVLYFLLAFVIYGLSDLMIYIENYREHLISIEIEVDNWEPEGPGPSDTRERVPSFVWIWKLLKPVIKTRGTFEYVPPVLSGLIAIVSLIVLFLQANSCAA